MGSSKRRYAEQCAQDEITREYATELLKALKALLRVHRQQDTCGVLPADKAIAYGQAEDAIAKAEGQSNA